MSEFYMIFARKLTKFPNFTWFLPEKYIFPEFGGKCPLPPVSYAYVASPSFPLSFPIFFFASPSYFTRRPFSYSPSFLFSPRLCGRAFSERGLSEVSPRIFFLKFNTRFGTKWRRIYGSPVSIFVNKFLSMLMMAWSAACSNIRYAFAYKSCVILCKRLGEASRWTSSVQSPLISISCSYRCSVEFNPFSLLTWSHPLIWVSRFSLYLTWFLLLCFFVQCVFFVSEYMPIICQFVLFSVYFWN